MRFCVFTFDKKDSVVSDKFITFVKTKKLSLMNPSVCFSRYPVGIQTFSEIRERNYLYIDKTAYVYRLARHAKYVFLSRPRRFGKSLLTSTLHAYFEGRKELFEGLAIGSMETEWTKYPVLHFDMSLGKHLDKEALNRYLHSILQDNEIRLGISPRETHDVNIRLKNLIMDVYGACGRQVVVLIDEYDAPLLDVVHEEQTLPALRNVMRNFYSPLKACDPYLRFVFLTGITKFSQLSVFSELNNIENVSMEEGYAAICGITESEIREQMVPDVAAFAEKLQINPDALLERLKSNYDGYHFTWPSPDIYNPYSLLMAFKKGKIDSYWFGTGTPTYLIEMLRRFGMTVTRLGGEVTAMASDFDAPTETLSTCIPLLYQSGYYTIKDGDPLFGSYVLGIPNREVRIGLMKSLIPYYLTPNTQVVSAVLIEMAKSLYHDDMDGALRAMQTFLSTIPYTDNTDYEGHYQQVLYILFSLLGYYADVEVHTPRGRVDVVMRTDSTLYVIEVKLDGDAGSALRQIELKHYAERFSLCGLPVVKVGVNFDSASRTLSGWSIG